MDKESKKTIIMGVLKDMCKQLFYFVIIYFLVVAAVRDINLGKFWHAGISITSALFMFWLVICSELSKLRTNISGLLLKIAMILVGNHVFDEPQPEEEEKV